jgi:4-diphosphocytidyl-2-C-methyl-D-erythritol kinase
MTGAPGRLLQPLHALAPAKVNLGLFVGPIRPADGRHELVTVMQSISLADELALGPAPAGADADELIAPAFEEGAGENLVSRALRAFRAATGWSHAPVRVELRKRIPIAAGLGGGSADAACALRLCAAASGLGDEELLLEVARSLGADVPAQVAPGRWLANGAGERLRALPDPRPALRVLVLPSVHELSTADVYAHADELAPLRARTELRTLHEALARALGDGRQLPADTGLLENDLQAAAISLCPSIAAELELLRAAGAEHVMVSGSGPTVVGLLAREPRAAGFERSIAARSVGAGFGAVRAPGDSTVRHNLGRTSQ